MKKLFLVLFLIFLCAYEANAMTTISGRPAPGGVGNTNYCNDASAQLCLYMNGDGTDETDRTANGYTMTDTANSPATSTDVPSGYSGTSRRFVASSYEGFTCDEGNCPDLDINGASAQITVLAWVKLDTVPASGGYFGVIQKYGTSGDNRQWQMTVMGTGSNQWKIMSVLSKDSTSGAATADILYSDTTTLVASTWYHIGFVYNGSNVTFYLNGVSDSASPFAKSDGIFNGDKPLRIGHQSNSTEAPCNYFNGYMDEVIVLNRGLSASEVLDIYNNGITGNKGGSD